MRNPAVLISFLLLLLSSVSYPADLTVENDVLSVALSPGTAAIHVTDKRSGSVWIQATQSGYSVASNPPAVVTSTKITPHILAPQSKSYDIEITLGDAQSPNVFDLLLTVPGISYTYLPGYPFPFTNAAPGWQYVQNGSGEGAVMPLTNPGAIQHIYSWCSSQPWWGITDLDQAMMERLDTFRLPAATMGKQDNTVYAVPMKINYSFYAHGGYVALAKAYRRYLLSQYPKLVPLEQRVSGRPGISYLKDAVYVYFWDASPSVTTQLIQEMKTAGIDRVIAMFYLHDNPNRVNSQLNDAIANQGWIGGLYRMPTPNLFNICTISNWNTKVLTGQITEQQVLDADTNKWDQLYSPLVRADWLSTGADTIATYHNKLFYFDTLTVQLAPCVSDPNYRESVEQNMAGRQGILADTQNMGLVVGSGEGIEPTWSNPYLDYFEGAMSMGLYTDDASHPASDHDNDFKDNYPDETAAGVDETMRVPLLALGFHDYAAETWVWRDTTFQNGPLAWKKELFNILYGAMPNWNMDRALWDAHKNEFIADYQKLHAVRAKIGFAEMTGHGWLTTDRSVQYSDWSTGSRVIVNFGTQPFVGEGEVTVAAHSYEILDNPRSSVKFWVEMR